MSQLDDLLLIPDRIERLEALKDYARSLNMDILQAKNNQGGYTEEKLVLLIFDAENNIQHERTHTYHFLSTIFIFATIILTLMYIFPKIATSIYNSDSRINPPPAKTMRAYDAEGKPIVENGQTVLFEYMDGVYQEFDDNGNLKYEYLYKKGELLRKTQFDDRGKIISVQTFANTPSKSQKEQ